MVQRISFNNTIKFAIFTSELQLFLPLNSPFFWTGQQNTKKRFKSATLGSRIARCGSQMINDGMLLLYFSNFITIFSRVLLCSVCSHSSRLFFQCVLFCFPFHVSITVCLREWSVTCRRCWKKKLEITLKRTYIFRFLWTARP